MTHPTIQAVRSVLGPMTSESKAREVVLAVLRSVREPSEGMKRGARGGPEGSPEDDAWESEWYPASYNKVWDMYRAMLSSLIQELET